ncbi:MAG: hypothetical protein EPO32_12600 [Anaerolineae bacterium]|nr:MAG: hypothetical protein EPO32_12600 [Anaerolineae bacterium]
MSKVKLMMSWDIQPGKEEEYFEFHVREFVPALERMGLALNEAWLTVYGEHQPRLTAEALINSLGSARTVLDSSDWQTLDNQLGDLVENFSYKVIPARTRWQM